MSALPSSSEQFLGGLAAGAQNLNIASANQQAKMNYSLGQQQMGLQREKMAQEQQMQQAQLAAEETNNVNRQKMHEREMAQQQSQFTEGQKFTREQNNLEQMANIRMKKIEMDLMANEQEIAASMDNDPALQEKRAKRRNLKQEAIKLQSLITSSQTAMSLAQGLREDRLKEVDGRLTAFQESVDTRRSEAEKAVQRGFQYAMTKNAVEGGFWNEAQRLSSAGADYQGQFFGDRQFWTSQVGAGAAIALDNVMQWFGMNGNADLAASKMTDFMQNGGAMAAQTVYNAIDLDDGAFGLDAGNKAKAATLAAELVTNAGLYAYMPPEVRNSEEPQIVSLKEKIAQGIGEFRKMGMGDEQISAVFEGLEALSQNRAEISMQYALKPNDPTFKLLDRSLQGVGRIEDLIQNVIEDEKFMAPVGGKIVDHSKFDWVGVTKNARIAYGMGQSPEMTNMMRELQALGATPQEIKAIAQTLTESDPRLKGLRPEDYAQALTQLGIQQQEQALDFETATEEQALTEAQLMARGRTKGLQQGRQNLEALSSLYEGGEPNG